METLQVQVEYGPGKIRKFNVPDRPCTYEELKCDIQSRIQSLMGKEFGLQYLDDDGNWVIAISDTCIIEAFRCAVLVPGTSMRRLKLKTFDGCSPKPTCKPQMDDRLHTLSPKSLFGEKSAISEVEVEFGEAQESLDSTKSNSMTVYKSPLELLMCDLEDDIHVKSVELDSAREHLTFLEKKYSNPNIKIDKTKTQCGQCHMRIGHTKRNCTLGVCEGPQICNDLDKHDQEKKQVIDAQGAVKLITKDLEKLKQNLVLKKQTYQDTCDTFFSKVLSHLVNTNIDKYYPVGTYGLRSLCMGAIHPDMAILDKHFRGIVPKDLESTAKYFPQILDAYKEKHSVPTNPVKRFMEERGVRFPIFSTTACPTMPTVPAITPSVACVPTYAGIAPFMPFPYPFPQGQVMQTVTPPPSETTFTSPLPPKKRRM